MNFYAFFWLIGIFILNLLIMAVSSTEIVVKSPQGIQTISLTARLAAFSPQIPDGRLVGYLIRSKPVNACSSLSFTTVHPDVLLWLKPKILLAQQGPCSFTDQVNRAERAGFIAVIIFSNSSDDLVLMASSGQTNITIPAVFVGQMDGIFLWDKYVWTTGYYAVVTDERSKTAVAWELILILIPISIVIIPLAAIIVITLISGRCPLFFTAYANARTRTRLVTDLPERKVTKDEIQEDSTGCSICLESYKVGDKIRRILPCSHEFHSACVDPWLLSDNLVCPLCRREVRLHNTEKKDQKRDLLHRIYTIPLAYISMTSLYSHALQMSGQVPVAASGVQEHTV